MKLDTIGKNIRKIRVAKKMRQEDLAEKSGLSVTYIGMVERAEKTPSLAFLLAVIVECSSGQLSDFQQYCQIIFSP